MTAPSLPILQTLRDLNADSPNFLDQLIGLLDGGEYARCIPNLGETDLLWLVDYLDGVLDRLDGLTPPSPASMRCLHELKVVCGTRKILPTSSELSPDHLSTISSPVASGHWDVYQGTFRNSKVCIKRVRTYALSDPQISAQTFREEAVTWRHMKHSNILPFLGVTVNPLQLVSDWVSGGILSEFIRSNPDADRLRLLADIADGLCYLHSRDVTHGDLKGPNILVDTGGRAKIMGFRFTVVTADADPTQPSSDLHIGNNRWSAPEVMNGGETNKETDIFSLAMVMIEVFTGKEPFNDLESILAVETITQGKRPQRPTHPYVTGKVWELIQRCWHENPSNRPNAQEVLKILLASPPAWKQLIDPNSPADKRFDLIKSIFSDRDEVEVFKHLPRNDAQAFVDGIDEVLECLDNLPQDVRRRYLRSSYRICGRESILPQSMQIPLCCDLSETPQSCRRYADVWKGEHNGKAVAAKALRVYLSNDFLVIRKRFCKEVMTWKTLRHPNILPLMGVTMNDKQYVTVSEWLNNGNIVQFLEHNNADRLQLLADATKGLIYMHSRGIVHGDLQGLNILINDEGRAVLADFSLVTFAQDQSTFLSSTIETGIVRWMSPELLDPQKFGQPTRKSTQESDCYALGMVVYEVLGGSKPYGPKISFGTLHNILNGERPKRPRGEAGQLFTDSIWGMVERCWKPQPKERASAKDVLWCLDGTPPTVGETDDQSDTEGSDSGATD